MKHLIVSLHDFHSGSAENIRQQKKWLQQQGITCSSILVVPQFHHQEKPIDDDASIKAELTDWQAEGNELVLHGYFHDRTGLADSFRNFFWTRFYTHHEAEFLDLKPLEAAERLEKGCDLFKRSGWKIAGFIAPAWLMAPGLIDHLHRLGFHYTTTLRGIINLQKDDAFHQTQSLCYSTRAFWRRQISQAWNRYLFSRLLKQSVIRLSLHPLDLTYAPLRRQIGRIIQTALDCGFHPTTYADYVAG